MGRVRYRKLCAAVYRWTGRSGRTLPFLHLLLAHARVFLAGAQSSVMAPDCVPGNTALHIHTCNRYFAQIPVVFPSEIQGSLTALMVALLRSRAA
eukprot:240187-Chlamydomonas_euryale.AAC.2